MTWLEAVALAAIALGLYDIAQKKSLRDNSLYVVLFFSILTSSVLLTPLLLLSEMGALGSDHLLYVPSVDMHAHGLIFLKSLIVLASWLFGYAGMKHLPLTIVTPIKATQPIWTVIGALLLFGETLNGLQGGGVFITLVCYYLFSTIGKREGIEFKHNHWVWCLFASTLIGACSGLYDKYLMRALPRMTVQVYFTYYQLVTMGAVMMALWWRKRAKRPIKWHWSIAWIGVFLTCSDFLYFYALSQPDSLIAVVSPLRRTSFLLPFLYGAIVYKDKHRMQKSAIVGLLLIGVAMLFAGS